MSAENGPTEKSPRKRKLDRTVRAKPESPIVPTPTAEVPALISDLVGKTWAGYEIVSEIGRGGMAVVYKAYQPRLDRHVAIKFLLPQGPYADSLIERFQQEAKVVARLRHPNIVATHDFGEERGIAYLVMEHVDGNTLQSELGTIPLARGLRIVSQVARALDYAHGEGIVHRDVKPSNILLAGEDWALLSDFGIAKVLQSPISLTQTGTAIGTPEYMSPEQCRGSEVSGPSDIYSLGIVLYEVLAGRPPFVGDTAMSVLFQQVNEPPRPPRMFNPQIPDELEEVVLRAIAKDPSGRFARAGDLALALGPDRVAQGAVAPSPLKPAAPAVQKEIAPRPRRRRWAWALFIPLVLIVLGAAVFAALNRSEVPPEQVRIGPAACQSIKPSDEVAPGAGPPATFIDQAKTYTATIETSFGNIVANLATNTSPKTVNSFVFLAGCGFYDGLTFHRVVPGFVIQGGDPLGIGTGGPGYRVVEAPPQLTDYVKGTIAMAKTGADPAGASGSQFFIVHGDGAAALNGTSEQPALYALLGKVVEGFDVLDKIESQPRGSGADEEKPLTTIRIVKISITSI